MVSLCRKTAEVILVAIVILLRSDTGNEDRYSKSFQIYKADQCSNCALICLAQLLVEPGSKQLAEESPRT